MTPRRLTDLMIRHTPSPARGRTVLWDAVESGLGVRVTATGHRSFVVMQRLPAASGKRTQVLLTLGGYPKVSLRDARTRARVLRGRIAAGDDPRPPRTPVTVAPADETLVEHVAVRFIAEWSKPRGNRSWAEQERILTRYVVPAWTGRRIDSIRRSDVKALTQAIATTAPVQANRVLEVVKKLMAWALDEELIESHPAVRLTPPTPEQSRDRVLTDAEMKALWSTWTTMGYPFGSAFQMLALTATRCSEVAGMQWDELDLDANVWTIPTSRVKSKVPHVVPLSPPAAARLAAVPRLDGCAYVFSTRQRRPIGFSTKKVQEISKASGVAGWRTHDLRRTVRTELSRLGVSVDIAERVLGHTLSGVRGVYDRYAYLPEKRDALDRWATHLTAMVARDG